MSLRRFALLYLLLTAATTVLYGQPAPPAPAPLIAPVALPHLSVRVSPGCVDGAAFEAVVRRLPIRFTVGDAAHPCPARTWTVHEYGGSAWTAACHSYGAAAVRANMVGLTIFGPQSVLVRVPDAADKTDPNLAPLGIFWHEAGHFAVYPALTGAERAAWAKAWGTDKARGRAVSCYAGTNAEEGLSEALRLYETQPKALAAFPRQKAFLDTMMTPQIGQAIAVDSEHTP